MEVTSPSQAAAIRDWVVDAINRDDEGVTEVPAPFPTAPENTVLWAESDQPRPDRYVLLTTVAITQRYNEIDRRFEVEDFGLPTQTLRERTYEPREWALSVQVVSRLDPTAPLLSDTAGQWLKRVTRAFGGELAVSFLLPVGVACVRRDQINPLPRLKRGTAWETRAAVTLTFLCGETARREIDWVEQATGTGSVPPVLSLPFDSDQGAP